MPSSVGFGTILASGTPLFAAHGWGQVGLAVLLRLMPLSDTAPSYSPRRVFDKVPAFTIATERQVPDVSQQTPFEKELALKIVDVLRLEVPAAEISPTDRLFAEGLGLDSIDALEIAVMVSSQYGVDLKADDERNTHIFASLRNLAGFIDQTRTR